jgi:hypothetical protein
MYDDWSDDKRLEILFSYETEMLSFTKEFFKRGRKNEAERFMKKAEKSIPFSDEFKEAINLFKKAKKIIPYSDEIAGSLKSSY